MRGTSFEIKKVFDKHPYSIHSSVSDRANEEPRMIHFNATLGTPAMKTSGFFLCVAGLLQGGKIWTVLNPQHVQDPTARVDSPDVRFLQEYLLRERIVTAVEGAQFQTAIPVVREWGQITIHDAVRRTNAALLGVLPAYRAWDLTDFGRRDATLRK